MLVILIYQSVGAVGIGSLETRSYLNENFIAKIELNDTARLDVQKSSVRLASREDFERAGISINPILFGLDFAIENDVTGGPYIFVSSDIPIRDPYLHFVVELNFEGGTIAKEFTVLIDPIEFSVADPAFTFRERREGLKRGAVIGPIRRSDTLWPVAKKHRPSKKISVEQMMLALLKKNPNSFGRNNTNILLEGTTLLVPSEEEILEISKKNARSEVRRQYKEWKSSRGEPSGISTVEDTTPSETVAHLELLVPADELTENSIVSELLEEQIVVQNSQNAELEDRLRQSERIISLLREQNEAQMVEMEKLKVQLGELSVTNDSTVMRIDATLSSSESSESGIEKRNLFDRSWVLLVLLVFVLIIFASIVLIRKNKATTTVSLEGLALSDDNKNEKPPVSTKKDPDSAENTVVMVSSSADEATFRQAANDKDPLAGLNVYLAYERYKEAVDICKRAIQADPESIKYRMRLLEVFVASNKPDDFRAEAALLKELIGIKDPFWNETLELWRKMEDGRKLLDIPTVTDNDSIIVAPEGGVKETQGASEQLENLDSDLDDSLDLESDLSEADIDSEDSSGIEPGEIDLDLELEEEEVSKSDSIADLPIGPDEDRN